MIFFKMKKKITFSCLIIIIFIPALSIQAEVNHVEPVGRLEMTINDEGRDQNTASSIEILSNVFNTSISINREEVGIAPIEIEELSAGEYLLEAEAAGHETFSQWITIPADSEIEIKIFPRTLAGRLIISSVPNASATIDGSLPFEQNMLVPAGTHSIEITAFGYESQTLDFTIQDGETTEINAVFLEVPFSIRSMNLSRRVIHPHNPTPLSNLRLDFLVSGPGTIIVEAYNSKGQKIFESRLSNITSTRARMIIPYIFLLPPGEDSDTISIHALNENYELLTEKTLEINPLQSRTGSAIPPAGTISASATSSAPLDFSTVYQDYQLHYSPTHGIQLGIHVLAGNSLDATASTEAGVGISLHTKILAIESPVGVLRLILQLQGGIHNFSIPSMNARMPGAIESLLASELEFSLGPFSVICSIAPGLFVDSNYDFAPSATTAISIHSRRWELFSETKRYWQSETGIQPYSQHLQIESAWFLGNGDTAARIGIFSSFQFDQNNACTEIAPGLSLSFIH